MITEWVMSILTWVIDLLPEWVPLGFASSVVSDFFDIGFVADALSIFRWLDHYLPIDPALQLLGYTLLILVIGWTYSGVMWVWRNLPGKAT